MFGSFATLTVIVERQARNTSTLLRIEPRSPNSEAGALPVELHGKLWFFGDGKGGVTWLQDNNTLLK